MYNNHILTTMKVMQVMLREEQLEPIDHGCWNAWYDRRIDAIELTRSLRTCIMDDRRAIAEAQGVL